MDTRGIITTKHHDHCTIFGIYTTPYIIKQLMLSPEDGEKTAPPTCLLVAWLMGQQSGTMWSMRQSPKTKTEDIL